MSDRDATFIYGLVDPRDSSLRYIGKADNLEKRLSTHLASCESETNRKANWIRHLKRLGLVPEIFEIEECSSSDWQEREIYWIKHFRTLGADLVNGNDGGIGGISPTDEVRRKKSRANSGKKRTEETRAKISRAKRGKKVPKLQGRWVDPDHLARMVELARSPESRRKQSRSAKIRANRPENMRRMREDNPAKRPEVRKKMSESAKKRAAIQKELGIGIFAKVKK